ncbi:hypothetical protein FHS13_003584 [Nocardiopsis algeriensis]|uniref:Uncharacterized protein n=1 Tax=Nocardiopsis algeriensis TaxID=1478215 RepID=A0A841ITQ1_9ACTN|nr:hypothetical protein [Nocardiopsis algeriensis]
MTPGSSVDQVVDHHESLPEAETIELLKNLIAE